MNRPCAIAFYESDEEGCPVQTFLDALDTKRRAKLLAMIRLLEEQGPTLPFPYSSQVRGKIRELRAHYGHEHYRVLYFGAPGRVFVLLHAFGKRTEQVAERDVRIAMARLQKYLEEDSR
jgi:phage-related protein